MYEAHNDVSSVNSSDVARLPKRVVIVDDDADIVRVVTTLLTKSGYEVVSFTQFGAARNFLATSTPDVLIADVRLGAFNGLQLVIRAKLQRPETIAIVLTGFDDPVVRQETQSAGARYLVKPFPPVELLEHIH